MIPIETAICKKCKREKPLNKFAIEYHTNGRKYRRGTCKACRARSSRDINRRRSKIDPVMQHPTISIQEYINIEQAQEYKCAICKISFSELPRRPCIDHDHITGAIRGLLCVSCNAGIGMLGDNSELCLEAAKYLIKYGS